jgi:outer membrane protein assembly factor BamB
MTRPGSRLPWAGPVAALALGLPFAVPARSEDWPQFRGPRRDGSWNETGLLEAFPAVGPKVRWRQPVGPGWSSPVIAQGRVVVTDARLNKPEARERVLCFEEATGRSLWSFSYGVSYPDFAFVPGQGNGPTATPVIHEGRVYCLGCNGQLHCLNSETGAVIWARDLEKDYQLQEMMCRASPLIEGDLLVVFIGGKPGACVVALDRHSGREVWKALDEPVSNSSPVIAAYGGRRQLIVWTDESVSSLNPATGAVHWRQPMTTSNNDAVATPVVEGDRLLVSGLMFKLDPDRPAASVLWPDSLAISRRILSNTSMPVLRGGHVYGARSSGELVCLDATNGRTAWEVKTVTALKGGASIHITITSLGDVAFLFTEQGNLIRAELTPSGYRETDRARLVEPNVPSGGRKCAWTPPAFANGHVFARNDVELVCASLKAKE